MSPKRLLITFAALALAGLGLAACGGDGETKTVTVNAPPATGADGGSSGKTVNIIASVPPTDHGWLGAISKNAKAAAEAHKDVKFELLQAADADSQAQQIEQAIAKKPDVLVVEIQGLAGISVTEDRTKGFNDEIKKRCPDGGVKLVASQPGDFNPDTGLKVMENILQAQKKIDAVYTHDDDMAQGVVQAIRNANRDDEMFLTGVGGSEDAMKQIEAGGLYRATFLYNPNMAATAVNMARLLGLGQGFPELVPPEVPRQVVVPAAVVTKDNVGEYKKYAFN